MTAFDLEQHAAQWRRELEATLAFSPAELDELEDHLRSSFEVRIQAGESPESAWTEACTHLGGANALALEFAKDKLMPALGRLMLAWWKPALLLIAFAATAMSCARFGNGPGDPWGQAVWLLISGATLLTLLFLPAPSNRIAILVGIGNAVCLFPLLHLALYNVEIGRLIGPGWAERSSGYRSVSEVLGFLGLVFINRWSLRRLRQGSPVSLAIAGALIFSLALVPAIDDLFGNIAFRELYELPQPGSVHNLESDVTRFNNWYFVRPLFRTTVLLSTVMPLAVIFAGSVVAAAGGIMARMLKFAPLARSSSYPGPNDLPWILALGASGAWWNYIHFLEPVMDDRYHGLQTDIANRGHPHGGLEVMVLCAAVIFLVIAIELTRRIVRAPRVRPFYATLVVVIQLLVLLGLVGLPRLWQATQNDLTHRDVSFEPAWLSVCLCAIVFSLAVIQACVIRLGIRGGKIDVSLWKLNGANLVEFGLGISLALACAGSVLMASVMVMARMSTIHIRALLDWSHAMQHPASVDFHPENYRSNTELYDWIIIGPGLLSVFLTAGLALALILSAMEFIRFNTWRLLRLRKARERISSVVAMNE